MRSFRRQWSESGSSDASHAAEARQVGAEQPQPILTPRARRDAASRQELHRAAQRTSILRPDQNGPLLLLLLLIGAYPY